MIANNRKITKSQNAAMIISTVIGVGILSLPSNLAEIVGADGWVTLLITGLATIIVLFVMTKLVLLYKDYTLVEMGRELVGRFLGDIVSLVYLTYTIAFISVVVRVFAEVVKMFLLNNTPLEVIIITMLLTTAYLTRKGIECIARIIQVIIPLVIIPIFVLWISLFPDLDISNILPVFQVDFMTIIKGVPSTFFSFVGFEIIYFTTIYVKNPEGSVKHNLIALLSILGIYILAFLVSIFRFGKEETIHLIWPTLSLMKTINLPGAFIENVEGVVMAFWVLMVLGSLVTQFYCGAQVLSRVTGSKEFDFFVLPMILFIYFIALLPDNIAEVYDYIKLIDKYLSFFLLIVVPFLYYGIALIKKKKKGSAESE
ncbi:GerAB/ArcD/ProY family transporter [Abyssisolibacter fermentans]|uniref:GerAB/ArcD/ProY family transporter n=1 Tax=Abyssisolibacter fermentans TaxID=1766203 RepID=UPI000832634F|nr:endospore germination permease [Abyssisolibacter fermentans]